MRSRSARVAACLAGLVLPLTLAATADAAPNPTAPNLTAPNGESRILGTGWFFEHRDFGRPSAQFGAANGACVNLPPEWQRKISSLSSWAEVTLYSQPNCWQDGRWQRYPAGEHRYVGDAMNDRTISLRVLG